MFQIDIIPPSWYAPIFQCGVLLLVVLSPVILGAMFLLAIANRGKVFFTQERPGKNENGNVIIEAAAMGTPAIASDIPCPIDAIISNENGFLIQKANTASLRNAMRSIICSDNNPHFSSNHIAYKTASRFDNSTFIKEIYNRRLCPTKWRISLLIHYQQSESI